MNFERAERRERAEIARRKKAIELEMVGSIGVKERYCTVCGDTFHREAGDTDHWYLSSKCGKCKGKPEKIAKKYCCNCGKKFSYHEYIQDMNERHTRANERKVDPKRSWAAARACPKCKGKFSLIDKKEFLSRCKKDPLLKKLEEELEVRHLSLLEIVAEEKELYRS